MKILLAVLLVCVASWLALIFLAAGAELLGGHGDTPGSRRGYLKSWEFRSGHDLRLFSWAPSHCHSLAVGRVAFLLWLVESRVSWFDHQLDAG
jgi:hypothetical protein